MLIILLVLFAVITLFIAYKKPHLLKMLMGAARVLSSQIKAVVKVNGRVKENTLIFHVKRNFKGVQVDQLVLYLPDDTPSGRSIFIFDRNKRWLGLPNAGDGDYDLLQGKYLFQSKAGANFKAL